MRNGILGSLLLLLTGACTVAAQPYPYPAAPPNWPAARPAAYHPNYGAPPGPQWPAPPYHPPPTAPMPPGYGHAAVPPGYAPAPPMAPTYPAPAAPQVQQPPAAPAPAVLPPASPAAGKPAGAVAAQATDLPHQPVMKNPPPAPLRPDVPSAPPTGTKLVYDEPLADYLSSPPAPPHERDPPHYGPRGYCVYGSAEALFWWVKEQRTPPLASTGPLSEPGTVILVDENALDDNFRNGARFQFGTWVNAHQSLGLEVGGFWLAPRRPGITVNSPEVADFGNPFVSAPTGAESYLPVAATGLLAGTLAYRSSSELWGAEGNVRCEVVRQRCFHLDLIAGCRYLDLREGLELLETSQFTVPGLAGSAVTRSDRFLAANHFYGGQVGFDAEVHTGRWYLGVWGKVAVGSNVQDVSVSGDTVLTTGTGAQTSSPTGFYARATNVGTYSQSEIVVIPEVGINVGYELTHNIRVRAGYTFLYVSSVARPAEQIDRVLSLVPTAAGGPARPAFPFTTTDFWAHGLNVGLEFRF